MRGLPATALLLAALAGPASAQEAERPRRAIEILALDTLRIELNDRAVLDTRPMDDYLAGHIPSSHPVDPERLARAVLSAPEPPAGKVLSALGLAPVAPHPPLVVYGDSRAGRRDGWVAWLLSYAGLPQVDILDGGFAAWNSRRRLGVYLGHPVPGGVRTLQAGQLTPRPGLRVDPGTLADGAPAGSQLIEVRAGPPPEEGVTGQVLHAEEVLDAERRFLYPYHLERLLTSRGLDPEARFLLSGEPPAAGLVWAALAGNGFEAALVLPAGPGAEDSPGR